MGTDAVSQLVGALVEVLVATEHQVDLFGDQHGREFLPHAEPGAAGVVAELEVAGSEPLTMTHGMPFALASSMAFATQAYSAVPGR